MIHGFNDETKEKVKVKSESATDTALNNKQDKVNGAASTITSNNLTKNRALVSDANGKVAVSPITSTELGYLDNLTGNVQTQINSVKNNKQNTIYTLQKDVDAQAAIADSVYSATVTFTANADGYDGSKDIGIHSVFTDTNNIRIDNVTRARDFSNDRITYYVLYHGTSNGAVGTITFRLLMSN